MADPLTFPQLRGANLRRLPLFKNSKGEPAHSQPDGSDWTDEEWLEAFVGELGEFANLHKKTRRGDLTLDEARPMLASELADAIIYLDILAYRAGVRFVGSLVLPRSLPSESYTPSTWLVLTVRSTGNLASWIFLKDRHVGSQESWREMVTPEFNAIVARLDKVAEALDIDLGEAVREKFNLVSDKIGCDVKL